jgi:hypothetical protein
MGLALAIREETVLEKLERLKGAPRIMFLQKWVKILQDMIPPGVDPAVILGEPVITEDTVIKIFKEHCSDLVESECHDKLVEMFSHSKETRKNIFEKDFMVDFEVKSKISEAVSKALRLDFDVNPAVADSLYKAVFEERDPEKACELIKEDVKRRWLLWGEEPPAEDLKLAEEACNRIKELASKRAPPAEWWEVLAPVYKTREELAPSIKPYIAKVKQWRIHEDMDYLVRRAKPEDILLLLGEGGIRKAITTLSVRFIEDMKPIELVDKKMLEERLRGKVGIYASIQAKQANELWYVNKFRIDKAEIPISCVYVKTNDYIVACDRPAILVWYAPDETKVIPIALTKMVKELFRRGILVEAKA